jgi:protein SDA1
LYKEIRSTLCKALILLRNKNFISALDLLALFFELLKCPDKNLRKFLQDHIITDIKNMNAKHKDMKLNSSLQNFMYVTMTKDSNPKASKMSLDIMIELYKKNIWNDKKTVNVIASIGCFSKTTKILVASLKFFLGTDEDDEESSDSEQEVDLKAAMMANRVTKKTKKRTKQLENVKKAYKKSQKEKSKPSAFNFSAIHLIHNPQQMAENLFKQLQDTNERFEVKLLHLDVISRLIGIHDLFIFSYYPYITRFIQPQQRQVTRILQFAAQATHELVPPEVIEPIVKTIANNFITERNSSDVMAIGLNSIREICRRCLLAADKDLLNDLVLYKNHKDKSVVMAARSLIGLYREQMPSLLIKKERGRPTEATLDLEPIKYGAVKVVQTIPGSEVLLKKNDDENENSDESEEDDSDEEDSDDDEGEEEKVEETLEDKKAKEEAARELSSKKIFTDEDFEKIEQEMLRRKTENGRRGKKRKANVEPESEPETSEFVSLSSIEMIYKKRRTDKQSRIEKMKEGREGREKFGYKDNRHSADCSKTNREKQKNKNFMMMRHKARGKIKKSFRDKQIALRNHLTKQKKMK